MEFVHFIIPPGVTDACYVKLPRQPGDTDDANENFGRFATLSLGEAVNLGMLAELKRTGRPSLDMGAVLRVGLNLAWRDWKRRHKRGDETAFVIEAVPETFEFHRRFELDLPKKG